MADFQMRLTEVQGKEGAIALLNVPAWQATELLEHLLRDISHEN